MSVLGDTYDEALRELQRARQVIDGLRIGDNCWCEMAIGNPMVRDHSPSCRAAQEFMRGPRR